MRQPRRHSQRIPGKRAGLINGSDWRDQLHQVAPATVRAHGQATADYLAQCRQIRSDSEPLLRATQCHAKAGHHFIKNEQSAVLTSLRPQFGQEFRDRRDVPRIAHDRLHYDACDLVALLAEEIAHALHIVER